MKGILESQTLWATHYKHLNDTTEIEYFREPLEQAIFPLMKDIALKYFRRSFRVRREIRKLGGVISVAEREAKGFIGSFYKTTFERGRDEPPFAEPFITSFCAHDDDEAYERENGLLSQWRAYADGGYILVFDTRKLWELADIEGRTYHLTALSLGDVVYEGDNEAFQEEFSELINIIKDLFLVFLDKEKPFDDKEKPFDAGHTFEPFVSSAARYKHQGFKEEREVRFVVCPVTEEMSEVIAKMDPKYRPEDKQLKTIKLRTDGEREIPYIELFDYEKKQHLPIKTIIVGPHREQAALEDTVSQLVSDLRLNVAVKCSETPYIGGKSAIGVTA